MESLTAFMKSFFVNCIFFAKTSPRSLSRCIDGTVRWTLA